MNLNELTISQAARGLRQKKFTVRELTGDCLKALREKDGDLHAFLEIFPEAEDEAKKADAILQADLNQPPLFGIPLALKDNILLEGKKASAGSKILENYVAAYDATAVKNLKNQGALFLGKTNLDEFAMGSSTENSGFGPTRNPYDRERVPGGSSGGSAAAVAANLVLGALGSDTGGSIRQPAAFCGVVGFKPTYGRVSRHGLIAMASSLDQIGPLAKTVEDTEIIFSAISGKDIFDSTTTGGKYMPLAEEVDLKNISIGLPKEYFDKGLDPRIEKTIKTAMTALEKAGAKFQEITLPHSDYALATYYIVVPSEVSANLARFDGIRYGKSESGQTLSDTYTLTRAHGFGPEVKRRILLGTYALSAGYYDAYYLKAQKVRRLIREDFSRAFQKVDIIIGPTTPTPAFRLGERSTNPLEMYLADIYTVALNLAGIPGISLPVGFITEADKKLPVGLQLIGPWFADEKLLGIAKGLEKIIS